VPLLFTENETNNARLFGGENSSPYVKDGINDHVVHADPNAVNPVRKGTKVAADYQVEVAPGGRRGRRVSARRELADLATGEPPRAWRRRV
jgi:hypothetical protein